MTRTWLAVLAVAGLGIYGQQYPAGYEEDGYDQYGQGVYAPAPPPAPYYSYQRPPMPAPGYCWVDGYWNFRLGRYVWINGYWSRPPYAGGYWVAPRYTGGRFFVGFWGGGPSRGYVRYSQGYSPRYSGGVHVQSYRGYSGGSNVYRSYPNHGGSGYRNNHSYGHRGDSRSHGGRR